MHLALDSTCLTPGGSLISELPAVHEVGCAGITLRIARNCEFTIATPTGAYSDLRRQAADIDLRVAALITPWSPETPTWRFPDESPESCRPLFERAAEAGANVIVLDHSQDHATGPPAATPDDWTRAWAVLDRWQWEAESYGIMLALATGDAGWFPPRAAADLVDAVNSPWVTLSLHCHDESCFSALEWIPTLGTRIGHFLVESPRVNAPDSTAAALLAALRSVGYDDVITLSGVSDHWSGAARRLVEVIGPSADTPSEDAP